VPPLRHHWKGTTGTGKTRLALLLRDPKKRWIFTVQDQTSSTRAMTYELFVGGLAPEKAEDGLGVPA
jgi:hypothetical protein